MPQFLYPDMCTSVQNFVTNPSRTKTDFSCVQSNPHQATNSFRRNVWRHIDYSGQSKYRIQRDSCLQT